MKRLVLGPQHLQRRREAASRMPPEYMTHKDLAIILYRLAEQDRKLDAIHDQAVIANRRLSKLEKWQSFIEGGLAVLTILVVPLVIYAIAIAGLGPQAIAL